MTPIEDAKIVVISTLFYTWSFRMKGYNQNKVPSKIIGFLIEGGLGEGIHAPRS